jgi:hypothetical protein
VREKKREKREGERGVRRERERPFLDTAMSIGIFVVLKIHVFPQRVRRKMSLKMIFSLSLSLPLSLLSLSHKITKLRKNVVARAMRTRGFV